MVPVLDVAEFIFQCMARMVVFFGGTLPVHDVVRREDGSATIHLTVRLWNKRNFRLEHWVSGAQQIFELVRDGHWRNDVEPAPGTLERFPPPHPYRRAKCVLCGELVDPVTLWSLRSSWPPRTGFCAACFGPNDGGLSDESARANGSSATHANGQMFYRSVPNLDRMAEPQGSRSHDVGQAAGVATEAGSSLTFASDVLRARPVGNIKRGRHHKKNARRRQRKRELRRATRTHGLRIDGKAPVSRPRVMRMLVLMHSIQHRLWWKTMPGLRGRQRSGRKAHLSTSIQ